MMWVRWLIALVVLFLVAGCNRTGADFFIVARNAKDLTVGSKVMWRGQDVGEVVAVEPQGDEVRIEATLRETFRERLRADLRAAPVKGALHGNRPVLELYGGENSKAPKIQRGQQVAQAGVLDSLRARPWLTRENLFIAGGVLALVLMYFVVKGIIKLLTFFITIAICAAVLWFTRDRWMQYGHDIAGPEFEARLSRLAEKTIHSPAAAEAWRGIQRQFAGVGEKTADSVKQKLSAKAEDLRKKGDEKAADELSRLRENVREKK